MKKYTFFLLALALVSLGVLNSCAKEQIQTDESEVSAPVLSLASPKTYYFHDGSSPEAQSVYLKRNTDGSVDVKRKNVPWTDADLLAQLVTLDHTLDPQNPEASVYGPSSIDAWFIPFGNGPIEALQKAGEWVQVYCFCRDLGGYCDSARPPTDDEVHSCFGRLNCERKCSATVVFSHLGTRGAGVVVRATQINLLQ